MKNTQLSNLLRDLGFQEKEAEIYLSALELGRTTILEISKHSGIKRSTVYELLPELESKGLLKRTKEGKKFYFIAENPKLVSEVIHQKEKRFEEALPEFMALFNSEIDRPKVFFYQGVEEVQRMYEDTLREGKPLLNYTSIINLYQYLKRSWVDNYIKRRTQLGISTRIIAVDSPEAREWAQDARSELREIKLVPNTGNFSADVHIYGDKVIITTYKNNIFGLLIEDANIAAMQRMAFELMWQAANYNSV